MHTNYQPNVKSTIKVAANFTVELNQSTDKNEKRKACNIKKIGDSVEIKRENKVLHGQYIRSVDRYLIGGEVTLIWL